MSIVERTIGRLEKAYLPCIEQKETASISRKGRVHQYKRIEGLYIDEFSN